MTSLIQSIEKLRENDIINDTLANTLLKRVEKQQKKASAAERQSRVNQAVALYISNNWVKGQGYRVKATELALKEHGISRKELETAMKTMHSQGLLTHNKDTVKNNCHVQWRLPVNEDDAPDFGSN
jgi:tetraacyldisaccharide-1-P 4'-kinase